MPKLKPIARTYSHYTRDALSLLGKMIRLGRIERKFTAEELAERAGISRALLQRIEKGEPGCAIGVVFEVASIVGVPLFELERSRLGTHQRASDAKLALMPKTVRHPKKAVKDDF